MELGDKKFTLKKKRKPSAKNKQISICVTPNTIEKVDKLSTETGHSRNELINIFIEFGLKQVEVKE